MSRPARYRLPARRGHTGRSDLLAAARKRLADARRLLDSDEARHARGAAYLAGYAVECKLKSNLMEVFDCWTLDELADKMRVRDDVLYTHGLRKLAELLPSWPRLIANGAARREFDKASAWRPSWRYDGRDWTVDEARAFLDNVQNSWEWLDANR